MKYKDTAIFLLLLTICLFGIIAGVAVAKRQEVDVSGISSSITALKSAEHDLNKVFVKGFLSNLYLFIILSIMGMLVFGFPVSAALLFYKGYAVGFTCSCICLAMGLKGIAVSIVGVLLPSFLLMTLFCHMVYSTVGHREQTRRKQGRKNKINVLDGLIYLLIFIPIVYLQSVIQYAVFYKF